MSRIQTESYEKGYKEFKLKGISAKNPYNKGSVEWYSFELGFEKALEESK